MPPAGCCVLYAHTTTGQAFWVTSTPFAQYVKHRWAGAWVCSAFRNEGAGQASDMIIEALAATRFMVGDPPPLGMVTFIDTRFVRPIMVRGVPTYGRTYVKAGFEFDGKTKGGLLAFRLGADRFPPAESPTVPGDMVKNFERAIARRPPWHQTGTQSQSSCTCLAIE